MKKNHIYYFDYIRLMSAIGVIFMHIAAGPLRGSLNTGWHIMNLLTCFAFTAVPLFIMMSGYLVLNSEKTSDISFLIKKRLPRLVVPLITWTVIAVIWRLLLSDNVSINSFYTGMVNAIKTPAWIHFWYMYTLIALYIISPILYGGLKSLDKKGHIFIFVLICLLNLRTILSIVLPESLLPIVNIDILDKLSFLNGAVSIFILGYYLGNLRKKIPNIVLVITTVLILSIIVFGTYKFTIINGQYDQTFQGQLSGFEVILASCIFLLFKQNLNKECKLFKMIPVLPLFLFIYLMHNILLSFMYTKVTINNLPETIYFTIINFVACFLAGKTIASVKPICYIFTGLPYKDACKSCNWIYTYKNIKSFLKRKN